MRRSTAGLLLAVAQTPGAIEEVGNPMASHTLFIVLIVVAFLAWAASFSVHTMKERSQRRGRETLLGKREEVLDAITRLELEYESDAIDEGTFKSRMKRMRGDLARVVGQLQLLPEPPRQESGPKSAGKKKAPAATKRQTAAGTRQTGAGRPGAGKPAKKRRT